MECKVVENKKTCSCGAEDCARHGVCCECLRYHASRKSLPSCLSKLDWLKLSR